MKFSDLSKIDIKDVDFVKIKDLILQRKEVAVQVVLGVATLIAAMVILIKSQIEVSQYKSQISKLQSKFSAIEDYNKSQNDVRNFLNAIPEPVLEDKIINLVTDFAGQNGVRIVTFTQAVTEQKEDIESTSLWFTLSAESFVSMIRFMASIEKSKDFMQIWSSEIEPEINVREYMPSDKKVPVNFRIQVASSRIKQ